MTDKSSIPDHDVKCNMCEWQGYEEDLEILYDKNEAYRGCPNCKTDEYLSDIDEECPYLKKDKCTYSEPCPNNLSCKAKNLSIADRLEHGIKCAREQLIHIEEAYREGKYTENEYFPLKWTVEKILNVLEGSP